MTVKVFISYSHKDDEFRRKLNVHLATLRRDGAIETFFDGDIHPGADLDASIRRELRAADVFVALASPEYLHSTYCFEKEYQYALRRAGRKTMYVVVAVIRPCGWKHTRMGHYKALPKDGKEVTNWGNRDSAFEDIVEGVRRVVKLAEGARVEAPPAKAPRRTKSTGGPEAKARTRTTEKAISTKAVRTKVVKKTTGARPTGTGKATAAVPRKVAQKGKATAR